jgi:acyl CoA:acetate/3-ketoacid CoA transferase
MAFTDPILLNVTGADDPNYTKTGMGPTFSTWVDNDPPAGVRREMQIRHSKVGKPNTLGAVQQRHLVQFKHSQFNATLGKDEIMIVNLTISLPTTSDISAANQLIMTESVSQFLATSGFVAQLLRNEI